MKKLLLLLVLLVPLQFYAQEFTYQGINYTVLDEEAKTCKSTGCLGEGPADLIFPEIAYNGNEGYKLTTIGEHTVTSLNRIQKVEIPNSVNLIEYGAFNSCETLNTVIIQDGENTINFDLDVVIYCPISYFYVGRNWTNRANEYGGVFYGYVPFPTTCTVEIGPNVTHLPNYAFHGFANLTEIRISDSIVSIGRGAFYSCENLKSIELPNHLETIEDFTFNGCENLESMTLPSNIVSIGNGAFASCVSLPSIELPETLESIGEMAFAACEGFTELTIPSRVTEIGNRALSCPLESLTINCNKTFEYNIVFDGLGLDFLKEVKYGEEVENIWIFSDCESLEKVVLPPALKVIPTCAFMYCSALKVCDIPETVTHIGSNAFWLTKLSEYKLPPNLVYLGSAAFCNCPITSIEFPGSLTSIEGATFSGCGLIEINIPPTIQTIGNSAFAMNQISNLTLPKTLKSVGSRAFENNPIEKLTVNCNVDISNLITFSSLKELVYGDDGAKVPALNMAPNLEKVILPTNLTTLVDNAFAGCKKLKGLELPPSLKTIGQNAFDGCKSLDELVLPSSVNSIGSFAFANCSSLKTLKLPEGVKSIGESFFENCTSLEKVSIPSTVTYFGTNAFKNCTELRSVIVPNGVENIPPFMMQGCSSVNEILLPNSVKTIGDRAFADCTDIMNVNIGTGIYEIADYAFENCPIIKDIHCMGLNPPYAERYTFPTSIYNTAVVTVQEQSLQRYNNADPWYRFLNYMTVSGAVSLSHYNVDMAGNEVFQLGVYGANSKILWTSSNPSVAYANECGLIVAMGITGSTTITARVDGEEINCRVTVSAIKRDLKGKRSAKEDEELIEPVDMIIESISGNPPMVNVRLIPIGSCTVIDWTSSDESIASVENGIVTVHEDGDVEFGAETENGLGENLEVNTDDIGETGIFEIFDDLTVENTNVYDFTGRCLIIKASEEQIKHLNKGLYIINGKKVLIK